VVDKNVGFRKYDWLPAMNTPVFSESSEFGADASTIHEDDFLFGHVPKSKLRVGGAFQDALDHHTAILGVTGSGKTELAFDLIRHAISGRIKVICIDLTARYRERLADTNFTDLSISDELAEKLGEKLFDVETGTYGAGGEKKALSEFAGELRDEITNSIQSFLESDQEDSTLGIIELNEISNTKATLYVTELYLTCLLRYAREQGNDCPRVLIVVEEAHTVMPEPATMGLGDYDSRGLVGKIAQIALQGRKYRVGLLVLAQRTATVSKSVLTQCNTIISFSCFDDTSLGFLKNILGEAHIKLIPNLPHLHAVMFGRGIRSQRPIVVQIPFDPEKAGYSE
jgi:DNA helicase HerA-like ATPase